jgi:hypothetical protein
MKSGAFSPSFICLLAIVLTLLIYAPRVGKGFVSDDFNWLANTVRDGKVNLFRPFVETTGFYRPLVGVSFGIQYRLSGLNPGPYGMFNLLVHLLNIVLVTVVLSRDETLRKFTPAVVLLFAMNAKADRMAVGWNSSRTMLLSAFFLLLTFCFYQKLSPGRPPSGGKGKLFLKFMTGFSFLCSLLCHEASIAAPALILFLNFTAVEKEGRSLNWKARLNAAFESIAIFAAPLTLYLFLRVISDAITPLNAPAYYQYAGSPLAWARNVVEYVLRAGILDIGLLLVLLILNLVLGKRISVRENKKIMITGISWFFFLLSPMLFLSVRSDLYVYFAQIGLHAAFLAIAVPLWRNLAIKPRFFVPLFFLLVAVWSVYLHFTAGEIERKGVKSDSYVRQIVRKLANQKSGATVRVIDRQATGKLSPSRLIASGFSPLLNLYLPGKKLKGEIVPVDQMKTGAGGNETRYFIWEKDRLAGPYLYTQARALLGLPG